MRLNLGCGQQVTDGWINVDYALGARFAKVPLFKLFNRKLKLFDANWNRDIFLHDLRKKLPWPDGIADVVYSSHTLEHFDKLDGRRILKESHRVLRSGGVIRIVVPDLMRQVTAYLDGETRADDFVEQLGVLYEKSNGALKNRLSPFIQFPHKCMYDSKSLLEILSEIGFSSSVRAPFDSEIDDIRQIELEDRTTDAVIVEGRKR